MLGTQVAHGRFAFSFPPHTECLLLNAVITLSFLGHHQGASG